MLDGVLVANEILDLVTITKKMYMMFKIDFEKEYDKFSWDFLIFIMKKMSSRSLWMQWMEASVFSSHMSILVNGRRIVDFEVERGLCRVTLCHFFYSYWSLKVLQV